MVSKGFPNVVTSRVNRYNYRGEAHRYILYTTCIISRHAGTPKPQSRNTDFSLNTVVVVVSIGVQCIWTKSSGLYIVIWS